MKVSRTVCLAFLCLIFVGCSDNDSCTCPPTDPPPLTYPTTLEPLDEKEIAEILRDFMERNPGVCVSLDEYGLPRLNPRCARPDIPGVSEPEAERLARNFLYRNRSFFRIDPSSELRVRMSISYSGDHWVFIFANQLYHGVEVLNTEITVRVAQYVYSAQGNHYSTVYIPRTPLVTAWEARNRLPMAVPFQCWTMIYASVANEPEKVVLPMPPDDPPRSDPEFELRVVWRFPLIDHGDEIGEVHVDTMTGEKLQTRWHIIC